MIGCNHNYIEWEKIIKDQMVEGRWLQDKILVCTKCLHRLMISEQENGELVFKEVENQAPS